ncbi:protein DMR6-LIKE OXYGENASE 2 [Cinnamomum micranthum f. kanehirae]|uniref:Protein DMR6-LIKE OXYGENASE 2 n=1 Tax=Cinnamomum micranthum f. kanehirae TaxID=337451 RepID=A0A3S3NKC4_9MAGN|nr:protein DMR6-LIKE OXYGENASE 2 [Cinnamomum micranthum f. kanehirae]
MSMAVETEMEDGSLDDRHLKGVRHLHESGITRIPNKYILPACDRPNIKGGERNNTQLKLKLPIIDLSQLHGPNRSQVLKSLANACEEYGFFQVINHGIPCDLTRSMVDVGRRFFELPFEERAKYMSPDMFAPVRYGTSFNQNKDGVFCWRDFLKLYCQPVSRFCPHWPSEPSDLRQKVASYTKETNSLFIMLLKAVVESLGLVDDDDITKEFGDGSQLMVINCFPSCPEPDLTLGMPPHSDYGFLTLVLQDGVLGLQVQFQGEWVTVDPLPNSFVVNVGDHLEIFSNGRYKSVLHRVLVNSSKTRISVASLHSLPFESVVKPSSRLITPQNPKRYKETDFATFLDYVSSCEPKKKNFLESRRLT